MKKVLIALAMLMLVSSLAYSSPWKPPHKYDRPYKGKLEIVTLSDSFMQSHYAEPGWIIFGFTYGPAANGICAVYINGGYPHLRQKIIRHEVGHCNGWDHG